MAAVWSGYALVLLFAAAVTGWALRGRAAGAMPAVAPAVTPRTVLTVGTATVLLSLLWWLPPLPAEATAATRAAFAVVSHAGDPPLLWALGFGVGAVLWWRGDRRLACGWTLALAGNGLTVRALKALLERGRPADAEALVSVSGHSFPSGHASGALVAWGLLGFIALVHARPRAKALALLWVFVLIAVSVGFSRWVIGAHDLSDVLAGWVCGGAWLAAAILGYSERARR